MLYLERVKLASLVLEKLGCHEKYLKSSSISGTWKILFHVFWEKNKLVSNSDLFYFYFLQAFKCALAFSRKLG